MTAVARTGAGEVVWGIDPRFLGDFYENVIQRHGAGTRDATTEHVVDNVIKPLTEAHAMSYIDTLEADYSSQEPKNPGGLTTLSLHTRIFLHEAAPSYCVE